MNSFAVTSTGVAGLDKILNSLRMGDNVVWQVDNLEDYKNFVTPYITQAVKDKRKILYIHFIDRNPILENIPEVQTHLLDPKEGFESFTTGVHNIIKEAGKDAFYVFDCLSNLLYAWATDLMIGNFFMVTCPYLFELNTIAYFAILRNNHSFKTIARIRETTQLFLDVYKSDSRLYIHPLKVWNRYTPTMFFPHVEENGNYVPIINSVEAVKVFSFISRQGAESAKRNLDYWDRLFLTVEDMLNDDAGIEAKNHMAEMICSVMIAREERIAGLIKRYFSLEDLLQIKARLIGTGFIGGKAVGMLLARNILLKDNAFDWQSVLEPHDSFYIGSDVFYSYIVQNGWWRLRMVQKSKVGYFEAAKVLKENMLNGNFPDEIKEQFQQMLEYFGQSPIIVRSSSLLEDGFGNAFAGKYESFFLVNQGTPEERYEHFVDAVKKIYSSSMNEDALIYRQQRGLEDLDEQMALLVQRVSGSYHKKYFFPEIAGVGLSYNTFVWKAGMDPRAGMLRMVFGLGTRAVERVDDDYPRIVALDMPLVKPHSGVDDNRFFSQHKIDLLNLEENKLDTLSLVHLMKEYNYSRIGLIASKDYEITQKIRESGKEGEYWIVDFDELLARTGFTGLAGRLLKRLESVYDYPVDVEFTVNFTEDSTPHINVLQCRPFQTQGNYKKINLPENPDMNKIIFRSPGNFMGGSVSHYLKMIVAVNPAEYGKLNLTQKYDIARLIGKINRQITDREATPVLLLGPGRWGTTTPSLGVPVSFSEINNMTALGEIADPIAGLIPELSFGTHFFQDLVETGIFYLALFPDKEDVLYNLKVIEDWPNRAGELVPDMVKYGNVVRVYDFTGKKPLLLSDLMSQKLICYFED